jgi:hypothetical protein
MNYHNESPKSARRSRCLPSGFSVKKSHTSRLLVVQLRSEIAVLPTAVSQLVQIEAVGAFVVFSQRKPHHAISIRPQ